MIDPLLAADVSKLLWAVPVSLAISFVYTASRFEDRGVIVRRGAAMFGKTVLFLLAAFAVLAMLSWNL